MSRFKPLSWLLRGIIRIVRGSPLMIQLIDIFYFPGMVFGNNIGGRARRDASRAAAVAFIFNYACYFSEIYRAGHSGRPARAD